MKKGLFLLFAAGLVAGLAIWGFVEGREEVAAEAEVEGAIPMRSRVLVQVDGIAVELDEEARKRAGIRVASVRLAHRSGEVEALATVLSPQELIDLRKAGAAARAEVERARAAARASRREYERMKALHGDDFNVSTKALDAAQAQWQADEAAAQGAVVAQDAVTLGARQRWGAALAAAVADDAARFRRLADGREVLLRVAVPAGAALSVPPATVGVVAGDGQLRDAVLISPAPQADPRIQGPTFFYAAAAGGLLPGTTLPARLLVGAERSGGIVPADAVVWWQGKAWYYVQGDADRFVRRELVDAQPVAEGWFVAALEAVQVVVGGAQMLLSEELRSQIQVGEEGT